MPDSYASFFKVILFPYEPTMQSTRTDNPSLSPHQTTPTTSKDSGGNIIIDIVHVVMELVGYSLSVVGFVFLVKLRRRFVNLRQHVREREEVRFVYFFTPSPTHGNDTSIYKS